MFYFYYFQCYQTNLYYGGITNNVLKRQKQHQKDLNKKLKTDKKPWDLYQDKIQLITLWSFNTKSQACVYEKQWIINNYLNPLCLNCSVSNSEYDCATKKHIQSSLKSKTKKEHKALCEKGGGSIAKIKYAINLNNAEKIYAFESTSEAAKETGCFRENIKYGCNNAKPLNSKVGRWLFSDVSKEDLKNKLKTLTQEEITGSIIRPFILMNKETKEKIGPFYSLNEPNKQGYNCPASNISNCILGKRKSVNGFTVILF